MTLGWAIALAVSASFNVLVIAAMRRLSRNPIDAVTGFCQRSGIEHIVLHVGEKGQARQLCPCAGCRAFLRECADHFETLDHRLGSEHRMGAPCVSPMVRARADTPDKGTRP